MMMKAVVLLVLLTVAGCDDGRVVGLTGHRVTLTCRYDVKKHGFMWACWNRGEIPNRGCNNQLIATDGSQVREGTRVSSRYQLLGRLDKGDVSLTILNLTDEDAGRYGCRLRIPGWLNDEKHHFDLTVRAPPTTTSSTPDAETTTTNQAAGTLTHVDTSEGDTIEKTGSDVTAGGSTEPQVQSHDQHVETTLVFAGNILKVSFIIIIVFTLMAAAFRLWRSKRRSETDRRMDQSEEEEGSSV